MSINLIQKNFEEKTAKGITLIDFWGDWCQPCKMLDPVLEKLEAKFKDQIQFAKVNVKEEITLVQRFNIQNIPTQILMVNGHAKEKITGYRPYPPFEKYLQRKIEQYTGGSNE